MTDETMTITEEVPTERQQILTDKVEKITAELDGLNFGDVLLVIAVILADVMKAGDMSDAMKTEVLRAVGERALQISDDIVVKQ